MGLIRNSSTKAALLAAAVFFAGAGLFAQNVPGQLGTEIQTLEQRLSAGIPVAERYDALVRLARLRQLSGNLADAAVNWLDAAAANPQDDDALVAGAYCLAAIGEWEKAAAALRPLFASGRTGTAMSQAIFLDACLKAWSADDASAITALAGNPEFAAMRPLIYYTLWQTLVRNPGASGDAAGTTGAEWWKSRLLAEFPQSPEARAANAEKQKNSFSISAVQSPLWLLFPGNAAGTAGSTRTLPATPAPLPSAAVPVPPPSTASVPTPADSTPSKPAAPTASVAPSQAVPAVVLQTGVFSKEANARAQTEALQKAGFSASITRKLVNGAEHWAVTVPTGQDQRKTIADLKKAGFDSFPVKL